MVVWWCGGEVVWRGGVVMWWRGGVTMTMVSMVAVVASVAMVVGDREVPNVLWLDAQEQRLEGRVLETRVFHVDVRAVGL